MRGETPDIVQLQRQVALHRSQSAYRDLFLHFHPPLTRFAEGFVKSPESAEEVYCDVMMKLWDLGPGLDNVGNLKVYLYTSVKNASLNYLAKYHKVAVVRLEDADIAGYTPPAASGDPVLEREFWRNASVAIKALPPQSRLVYKLIKEEGFSYKEVAALTGLSVNTVESHMKTALKKLRTSLNVFLRADRN